MIQGRIQYGKNKKEFVENQNDLVGTLLGDTKLDGKEIIIERK